jgi:CdiI N-terminal domain
MSFSIHVIDKYKHTKTEDKELNGEIEIGDFRENILIPISFWPIQKYVSQWKEAIDSISDGTTGKKSALITQIYDPEDAEYVNCWPIYRDGETVFVQNRLLFKKDLDEGFNPENIERYIDKRESIDEDGNEISEWKTTISELQQWQKEL